TGGRVVGDREHQPVGFPAGRRQPGQRALDLGGDDVRHRRVGAIEGRSTVAAGGVQPLAGADSLITSAEVDGAVGHLDRGHLVGPAGRFTGLLESADVPAVAAVVAVDDVGAGAGLVGALLVGTGRHVTVPARDHQPAGV